MSSRTIAVLVTVAVVAGIGVAAYGFATRSWGSPRGSSRSTR